jgi:hypothetical protein
LLGCVLINWTHGVHLPGCLMAHVPPGAWPALSRAPVGIGSARKSLRYTMAARKSPVKRKPPKGKPKARAKALALTDAVKSEAWTPHSLREKHVRLFRAMIAWTPLGLAIGQQAAFWEGYSQGSGRRVVSHR